MSKKLTDVEQHRNDVMTLLQLTSSKEVPDHILSVIPRDLYSQIPGLARVFNEDTTLKYSSVQNHEYTTHASMRILSDGGGELCERTTSKVVWQFSKWYIVSGEESVEVQLQHSGAIFVHYDCGMQSVVHFYSCLQNLIDASKRKKRSDADAILEDGNMIRGRPINAVMRLLFNRKT